MVGGGDDLAGVHAGPDGGDGNISEKKFPCFPHVARPFRLWAISREDLAVYGSFFQVFSRIEDGGVFRTLLLATPWSDEVLASEYMYKSIVLAIYSINTVVSEASLFSELCKNLSTPATPRWTEICIHKTYNTLFTHLTARELHTTLTLSASFGPLARPLLGTFVLHDSAGGTRCSRLGSADPHGGASVLQDALS